MLESLSNAGQPVTKKIAKRRLNTTILASRWSLPVILFLQVCVSLITLQNTAFQDEALYLFAGRQIVANWLG